MVDFNLIPTAGRTPLSPKLSGSLDQLKHFVEDGQKSLFGVHPKNENLLVVSPYEEDDHLLDLRTLDFANQSLAKALVDLKCLRDDYATAPYVDIFNVSSDFSTKMS